MTDFLAPLFFRSLRSDGQPRQRKAVVTAEADSHRRKPVDSCQRNPRAAIAPTAGVGERDADNSTITMTDESTHEIRRVHIETIPELPLLPPCSRLTFGGGFIPPAVAGGYLLPRLSPLTNLVRGSFPHHGDGGDVSSFDCCDRMDNDRQTARGDRPLSGKTPAASTLGAPYLETSPAVPDFAVLLIDAEHKFAGNKMTSQKTRAILNTLGRRIGLCKGATRQRKTEATCLLCQNWRTYYSKETIPKKP